MNIYEAKTQFSRLVKLARAGEEVVIAEAGKPILKLVPIVAPVARRVLGSDRGKIWLADDAFEPMSQAELAAWYEAPLTPPARLARPKTRRKKAKASARTRGSGSRRR